MNIREIAKKLAIDNKLPRADKYDLFLREFDNMVELIGLVNDPTQDMTDFRGREMLFPKKWVTLKTFFAEEKVKV
jgi:hypothetical protein